MNRPIILLSINRNRIFYMAVLIIFIAVMAILPSKAIQSVMTYKKIRPLDNKTIAIDPGHGGIDGGTNRLAILEKDINLMIGLKLRDLLVKKGANIIMTRETDDSLDDGIIGNGSRHREDLDARVKIVNESNADLLISIHVNYSKNPQKMGAIVYHHGDSESGNNLANHMQDYLNDIKTYDKINISIHHVPIAGDFYILKNTTIPGILIEVGFISNETDIELLLNSEHQNEIVEKITKGIMYYFKDKNN